MMKDTNGNKMSFPSTYCVNKRQFPEYLIIKDWMIHNEIILLYIGKNRCVVFSRLECFSFSGNNHDANQYSTLSNVVYIRLYSNNFTLNYTHL